MSLKHQSKIFNHKTGCGTVRMIYVFYIYYNIMLIYNINIFPSTSCTILSKVLGHPFKSLGSAPSPPSPQGFKFKHYPRRLLLRTIMKEWIDLGIPVNLTEVLWQAGACAISLCIKFVLQQIWWPCIYCFKQVWRFGNYHHNQIRWVKMHLVR